MAVRDYSLYQALVGRARKADRFYIQSGGQIDGLTGGIFETESGFNFYFAGSGGAVTAAQMRNLISDKISVQRIGPASVSLANGVFSVANLPANVGHVYLSMTSNTASPSFYMTSCVQGQDVWIHIAPGSVASGTVALAMSGCSLVWYGAPATSLTLYNSAASNGAVHLVCINDDEWTVVGQLTDGGVAMS